ncbi:hypothetical protein DJ64_24695 [Streptomyces griseorubens]|uniref:Transposase n=1 Tax=Streptomyces griseorubens TaxID=66897 RepID=A0ABR4SRW6_9ACTN|nr:hypothetical protein DJ64_24695 [Streptomyces griseorubens]
MLMGPAGRRVDADHRPVDPPCEVGVGLDRLQNPVPGSVDAVTAGLTLPWSSGAVEGHVNRIKMLKRQMFGRAGFALLRKRVLLGQ